MMETARELTHYLFSRKKIWLIPLVLGLLIFAGIIFLAQSSPIGPFIYTLF